MKILGSAIFGLKICGGIYGGDGKDEKKEMKKLDIFFVTIQIRDMTGTEPRSLTP